jgi:hypothetical protein
MMPTVVFSFSKSNKIFTGFASSGGLPLKNPEPKQKFRAFRIGTEGPKLLLAAFRIGTEAPKLLSVAFRIGTEAPKLLSAAFHL